MNIRNFTVLVVTGDPGGARVLIPGFSALRKKRRGCKFVVLAGPHSHFLWKAAGFQTKRWPSRVISRLEADRLLKTSEPDLLVTGTSFENPTESHFRLAAKLQSIRSFSALDHWSNYGQRYRLGRRMIVPDMIGVMDALARRKMMMAGIPAKCLVVVGHPVLEQIRRKAPRAGGRQILYLSEPISWDGALNRRVVRYSRHNELTVLKALLAVFARKPELHACRLLIRPHPLEPEGRLRNVIRRHAPAGLRIRIDRRRNLEAEFTRSRVVLGITSIALLQARLMGMPVLSLQPDLARGRIPDDILTFLPRVRSPGCFIDAVSRFISTRHVAGRWFSRGIRPSLPSNSAVRIASAMERMMNGR